MSFPKGWFYISEKITLLETDRKTPKVTLKAVPCGLWGWLICLFFEENETIIKADQKLFTMEKWDFFRQNIIYLPTRNLSSINLRENFLTGWVICSILSFSISILIIYSGYSWPFLENLKITLFVLGTIALLGAIIVRRRVLLGICHAGGDDALRILIKDKEEWLKLREAIEMIALMSTGKETLKGKKGK